MSNDFKTTAEIYRYLLESKENVIVWDNGTRVRLNGHAETDKGVDGWSKDNWSFSNPEEWSKYIPPQEPKKKRKLLCFISGQCGVVFIEDGTRFHESTLKDNAWVHCPGFDIEENDGEAE
jgi:hypothetical protein